MRTYYSGSDALVTATTLTIRPPKGPTYALRDLDPGHLTIVTNENWFVYLFPVASVVVSMLYGSPVIAYEYGWRPFAILVFVAAVIGAAGWAWYWRHRKDYTLEGVYRGTRTSLLTVSNEARAFQIRYAIREAMENPTEQTGAG
uniref:DUF6232 family protein n=1 Tax=Paractinoplanes polyasparticus TaxID=2856853 RepID=UPI001C85CC08|nr:DUF6232 family protein [Actinoplanes polyasparticus]